MDNMNTDIAALKSYNLTNLFVRIADTYNDGLSTKSEAAESITVLVEAKLIRRAGRRVHLTGYGWSVATRIAALDGAAIIAARKPSHWRTH